jgi:hypothetical protein
LREDDSDKAFVQSKSRVDFGAIFPWRKVRRIAETLGVASLQVLCETFSITLWNEVLVPEVRRDLGSVNGESIFTPVSFTI